MLLLLLTLPLRPQHPWFKSDKDIAVENGFVTSNLPWNLMKAMEYFLEALKHWLLAVIRQANEIISNQQNCCSLYEK